MNTTLYTHDPDNVFCWCQDIYKEYNIDLKFPKARDIRKTYQYRYLSAICQKFSKWNLDDNDAKRFLRIAIGNSFKQKTLKKGLSALHQKNLLDISYEQLLNSSRNTRQAINTIDSVLQFLVRFCGNENIRCKLVKRDRPATNMVITNLYQAGKINIEFLVVNDLCREIVMDAISKNYQDVLFLPSMSDIYRVKTRILECKCDFPNYDLVKKWGRS